MGDQPQYRRVLAAFRCGDGGVYVAVLPVVGDFCGPYVLKLPGQELRQVMLLRRAVPVVSSDWVSILAYCKKYSIVFDMFC